MNTSTLTAKEQSMVDALAGIMDIRNSIKVDTDATKREQFESAARNEIFDVAIDALKDTLFAEYAIIYSRDLATI